MVGDSDRSDSDADDPSGKSYDSGRAEREAHYPETGYNLVKISMTSPPGEALTLIRHSPTLSAITIPPAIEFEDYVAYDQHGRAYSYDDLHNISGHVESDRIDGLLETIQSSDGKELRLALLGFARIAENEPETCLSAIPALTTNLQAPDPAVQAEAITVLSQVATEYPEQVTPAAEDVTEFLTTDIESNVLSDAVNIVAAVADHHPESVVDTVPKLSVLLQDDVADDETVITALQCIAAGYPDAVVPITPRLLTYIEDGDDLQRIGAVAVLGTLSKEYPHVAEDTIPTAIELLDAEHYKLRANAAGLLADLSDEYPEKISPAIPKTVELLDDDDEKVRYNATSILAHIANDHPDDVESAIPSLIRALDDDFQWTRSNACWALGYTKSEQALESLKELKQHDPEKEVREAAAFAVRNITDT